MKTVTSLFSTLAVALMAGLVAIPAQALEFEYSYPAEHEIEARQIVPAQQMNIVTTYYGSTTAQVATTQQPMAPAPKLDAVIHFASASAKPSKMSERHLHRIAQMLMSPSYRGTHINVCGFSDASGSASVNQRLSHHRAQAVMQVLEADGVPAGMLTAQGFGADNPIATNSTAEGRAENRRVTFMVSH